jgi:hypothetical protein
MQIRSRLYVVAVDGVKGSYENRCSDVQPGLRTVDSMENASL